MTCNLSERMIRSTFFIDCTPRVKSAIRRKGLLQRQRADSCCRHLDSHRFNLVLLSSKLDHAATEERGAGLQRGQEDAIVIQIGTCHVGKLLQYCPSRLCVQQGRLNEAIRCGIALRAGQSLS